MEIAGKKRDRIIFFTVVWEIPTSAICRCDKESSSASNVPIIFTVVLVQAATGLPLLGFSDAEAHTCVNCWCQWKMVLQMSVCSPYASFIAAYVCVGVFFNKSWNLTTACCSWCNRRGSKFGTFDITAISAEFFARCCTTQNKKCSDYCRTQRNHVKFCWYILWNLFFPIMCLFTPLSAFPPCERQVSYSTNMGVYLHFYAQRSYGRYICIIGLIFSHGM